MKLSKKAIEEFKKICKKEYGTEISDEQAQREGKRLLKLFQVTYKPIETEMKNG